ncbi:sulfatase, partial [Candidatus Altiarchaeota archaeon]
MLSLVLVDGLIISILEVYENEYVSKGFYLNTLNVLTNNLNEGMVLMALVVILVLAFSTLLYAISKLSPHFKLSYGLLVYASTYLFLIVLLDSQIFVNTGSLFSSVGSLLIIYLFLSSLVTCSLILLLYKILSSTAPFLKKTRLFRSSNKWMAPLSIFSLIIIISANIITPTLIHQRGAGKPNVILVTIDTLRADHLGCYGYQKNTTPFIDEFSREAVIFKNVITPMPTTGPSHTTMLTGLYPSSHGVLANGWQLDSSLITLQEILLEKGYQTQAFVSVEHLTGSNGFSQGFMNYKDDVPGTLLSGEIDHYISPTEVTERALKWIDKTKQPFFLWIHYWDPHSPYDPPDKYDVFQDSG